MPRLFDAGDAERMMLDRITNLLRANGTGVDEIDEQPGWRFSQPTQNTILVENVEEPSYPRLLVTVEVSN